MVSKFIKMVFFYINFSIKDFTFIKNLFEINLYNCCVVLYPIFAFL